MCVHITGDIGEVVGRGESGLGANRIVVGKTVVSASLDVQRGEVKTAGPGRAEKEVAQVVDHLCVGFLGRFRGGSPEQNIDARFCHQAGIKESVGYRKVAFG